MPGKTPLLRFAIGVITKTSLLLQIENECPNLPSTYLGDIGTQTVAAEEIVEVGYASGDDCQGVRTFPFGRRTQLITMKQTTYVAARF
jgi:hypothetical protein